MWIEDLIQALSALANTPLKWSCCVEKIENGVITMTDGQKFLISNLKGEN